MRGVRELARLARIGSHGANWRRGLVKCQGSTHAMAAGGNEFSEDLVENADKAHSPRQFSPCLRLTAMTVVARGPLAAGCTHTRTRT